MLRNLLRRRYLISLTYLLVVLIGFAAWRDISLELAPNLSLPSITVNYTWGSTSPEVMEQEVTRKVEQAANRLRDVQKIQSISREGQASITITFSRNAPVEYRIVELQEYLFALRETLPASVRQGNISRRIPEELQDMETFLVYSISGDRPVHDLLEYARRNIRMQMIGMEGLADVEINGARDPALTIEFDTGKLENYRLSPTTILNRIRQNLEWRSSGYIESSGSRVSLLVPPQYSDLEQIRRMKLTLPGSNRLLKLSDIATVSIEDYPAKSMKRINGSPALSLNFVKETGADAIGLAEEIRNRLQEITASLPGSMTLQLERDSTEDLRRQFGTLQYQALVSIIVVFLVLLLFIRRFRAPFVILGSILFSILCSVAILYFTGYTLNVITLAGLTVALGMIIDNAVVVFEQLNPNLPGNKNDRLSHIKRELPHNIVPVLGSTLTTIGIFIPLFFAMEELRLFLVPLAVALTLTLVSSLFIALSWIPYALVWLVPPGKAKMEKKKSRFESFSLFELLRKPILWVFSLRHKYRWVVYGGLIAVLGIPLFAIEEPAWEEGTWWPEFTQVYFNNRSDIDPWIGGLSYRFFNETYFGSPWRGRRQERIYISIRTPQGTPIGEIDKMARNFEKIVKPYEEAFSFYETRLSEYSGARLVFYIKDEFLNRAEPYMYYAEAMYLAARTGNSAITVSGLGDGISTGFGSGFSGHRILLKGFSYDELLDLARDLEGRLKRSRRVREVDIHGTGFFTRNDLSQYRLKLNDDELAQHGLNRRDLLNSIALDVNPTNTRGRVEIGGRRMFLIGRNRQRDSYEEELRAEKRMADSVVFSLNEVAQLTKEQSQPEIRREDQSYFRSVRVDFLGPYRLASDYIKGVIEKTPVPVGARIQFGSGGFFDFGNDKKVQNLLVLLGLTLLSVWMIVSALLESWLDPLVVILAVPLSLIGIMAGTLYHDLAFDRGAIAGTLLCVGVVVNNSILLMHEKERFRSRGIHGLRSWLYVYRNKMRAVLITTLTTIGGLLPMILIGESEFWQLLATIVVWGLGGSTLLILLLMGIWEKNFDGN